ncbi:HAD family hydrolase [Austwickia sp. TVS 96-490-7B]|uniref:HAD family hydrolase n=1 Tax=Austwickia sp. TVS 96-490-7B TaxID=2830843 RepID=UPI001C5A1446|nr:HAD-IA family hydrolase [Austwickia sp. TVS 96-490-7B]
MTTGHDRITRPAAVLVDADGVIQFPPTDWQEQLHALGGPQFVTDCFEVEQRSLRGDGDFRAHLEDYLRQHQLSCTVDDVLAPWLTIRPDPEALHIVVQVREQGTPCYLATNQQAVRAAHMRATLRYEDVLDGCFYSYELGVAKPDPEYFRRIAARLALRAEELLFVDDRPDNVAAARAVGLAAEVIPPQGHLASLREIFTAYGLLGV